MGIPDHLTLLWNLYANQKARVWTGFGKTDCFQIGKGVCQGWKEYNQILLLTIWWCPCVESCVVGRECLLWPVHSLGKTLLAFALLHSVLQGQICLLLQVSLNFPLLHSSPLKWKGHLFGVLVLGGLVGFQRPVQIQLLQHYWSGHSFELLWYWMVCLEMNRDHSVIFEIAPKYCISDSSVNYEGYSISSKGFLLTVVVIMVIWVKFTHSSPF